MSKNSVNGTVTPEVFEATRALLRSAIEIADEINTDPQLMLALAGALLMGREEEADFHEHVFTLPEIGCVLRVGFSIEPVDASTELKTSEDMAA